LRKAPSPFSLCPLQNGSAQSGSLRLLHGRPVLLCRDILGRVCGSAERRCRRRRGIQKDLRGLIRQGKATTGDSRRGDAEFLGQRVLPAA
jgi:hypothetical protein